MSVDRIYKRQVVERDGSETKQVGRSRLISSGQGSAMQRCWMHSSCGRSSERAAVGIGPPYESQRHGPWMAPDLSHKVGSRSRNVAKSMGQLAWDLRCPRWH